MVIIIIARRAPKRIAEHNGDGNVPAPPVLRGTTAGSTQELERKQQLAKFDLQTTKSQAPQGGKEGKAASAGPAPGSFQALQKRIKEDEWELKKVRADRDEISALMMRGAANSKPRPSDEMRAEGENMPFVSADSRSQGWSAKARPDLPAGPPKTPGASVRDEHGCLGSAGWVWCPTAQKCLNRKQGTKCPATSTGTPAVSQEAGVGPDGKPIPAGVNGSPNAVLGGRVLTAGRPLPGQVAVAVAKGVDAGADGAPLTQTLTAPSAPVAGAPGVPGVPVGTPATDMPKMMTIAGAMTVMCGSCTPKDFTETMQTSLKEAIATLAHSAPKSVALDVTAAVGRRRLLVDLGAGVNVKFAVKVKESQEAFEAFKAFEKLGAAGEGQAFLDQLKAKNEEFSVITGITVAAPIMTESPAPAASAAQGRTNAAAAFGTDAVKQVSVDAAAEEAGREAGGIAGEEAGLRAVEETVGDDWYARKVAGEAARKAGEKAGDKAGTHVKTADNGAEVGADAGAEAGVRAAMRELKSNHTLNPQLRGMDEVLAAMDEPKPGQKEKNGVKQDDVSPEDKKLLADLEISKKKAVTKVKADAEEGAMVKIETRKLELEAKAEEGTKAELNRKHEEEKAAAVKKAREMMDKAAEDMDTSVMTPAEIMTHRKQKEIERAIKAVGGEAEKDANEQRRRMAKPPLTPLAVDAAAREIAQRVHGANVTADLPGGETVKGFGDLIIALKDSDKKDAKAKQASAGLMAPQYSNSLSATLAAAKAGTGGAGSAIPLPGAQPLSPAGAQVAVKGLVDKMGPVAAAGALTDAVKRTMSSANATSAMSGSGSWSGSGAASSGSGSGEVSDSESSEETASSDRR